MFKAQFIYRWNRNIRLHSLDLLQFILYPILCFLFFLLFLVKRICKFLPTEFIKPPISMKQILFNAEVRFVTKIAYRHHLKPFEKVFILKHRQILHVLLLDFLNNMEIHWNSILDFLQFIFHLQLFCIKLPRIMVSHNHFRYYVIWMTFQIWEWPIITDSQLVEHLLIRVFRLLLLH